MVSDIPFLALLPLGAHEYHGDHLPFETDWIIAESFAKALILKTKKQFHITCLPVEKIGYSVEHMDIAGTQTLTFFDAIERWINIGENCYRKGIKRLLLLNAHGGNSPLMSIVITELRKRFSMLAVATSWKRFGLPEGLMEASQHHLDIHGGFLETSLMLYLAPEKVHMKKAKNFHNKQADMIAYHKYLRAYGPHAFGWIMRDLNAQGAAGNASQATSQAGEAIFSHVLCGLCDLLDDINQFKIDALQ
ncbi:creatininase family protein [Bartonella bacilliformis]|uniref:Creatininase n=2 Tax=Bartonella bacilliformis TaxID=774 RepID=A1UTR6_BARBK|nr:creatininase family protein [Bartonella bacilliformis]ABM44420.1 creatininase [Bartonella bacilliformis KC583]AMG86358.1 creatininase [Bartonella bacilliformis]EKS43364.1 creatininase [Bartonella bacilliformis INS]KZN21569.1 creatininase [Bartonella bacilliformis]QFZ90685.1 creatininase family protein [Bartonella bacilliformis]